MVKLFLILLWRFHAFFLDTTSLPIVVTRLPIDWWDRHIYLVLNDYSKQINSRESLMHQNKKSPNWRENTKMLWRNLSH
jgi:hypothetical protein